MVHGVTVALSLAGVFGQVLAAALIIVGLLAASGQRAPLRRLRFALAGSELWVAFLIAGASTAGSLFFTGFASFYPGEVGWYERICMYPLSITTLLVALAGDRRAARYLLPFPLVGISLSSYAILLEDGVVSQPQSCVLSGPGGCVTKWINEFGYVTIPVLSITGFVLITSFLALAAFDPEGGAGRGRVSSGLVLGTGIGLSVLAIIAVAVAAASNPSAPGSQTSAAPPAAGAAAGHLQGNATLGKAVFEANGCGACHTLAAAGATGHVARPNLGELKLSYAQIVFTVTNGKTTSYGAAMSPFKHTLSNAEIENVAAFVYEAEHPPA
jgi:disulfide bond formation protein DsbB